MEQSFSWCSFSVIPDHWFEFFVSQDMMVVLIYCTTSILGVRTNQSPRRSPRERGNVSLLIQLTVSKLPTFANDPSEIARDVWFSVVLLSTIRSVCRVSQRKNEFYMCFIIIIKLLLTINSNCRLQERFFVFQKRPTLAEIFFSAFWLGHPVLSPAPLSSSAVGSVSTFQAGAFLSYLRGSTISKVNRSRVSPKLPKLVPVYNLKIASEALDGIPHTALRNHLIVMIQSGSIGSVNC